MNQPLTISEKNHLVDQFLEFYKAGVDAWTKAGEAIVRLVDGDPYGYNYILQKAPALDARILGNFEAMGRKNLHPQTFIGASPGLSKLRKLPYSQQELYVKEPVPVIVHTATGTDVLLVMAKNMTKKQADQVFASGRVRTEGEQKAWMMQKASEAARKVNPVEKPFTIKGSKITINGVDFTRKELAGMLAQMD